MHTLNLSRSSQPPPDADLFRHCKDMLCIPLQIHLGWYRADQGGYRADQSGYRVDQGEYRADQGGYRAD